MRNNIEAERGRLGMTKGAMCEALGITSKTYNKYISGAPIPSNILESLQSLTGCSIDYLLFEGSEQRIQQLDKFRKSVSWCFHPFG